MLEYVKNKIPEYFLCLIITSAVSINVFQGFWVPDSETTNLLKLVVVTSVMLLVLYFFFYNKASIILFFIILAAALISLIVYANYSGVFSNEFDIKPFLFYILSGICTVLVFAGSKGKIGIIALFLGDILTFFILIILEYKNYPLGLVVSLTALGIMFSRKIYLYNSRRFRYKKDISIKFTGILVVLCFISMLSSLGVYYGIIHPLNPPSKKLALLSNPSFVKQAEKFGLATPESITDNTAKTTKEEITENIIKTKNQDGNTNDNKPQDNKDVNAENNAQQQNQLADDKNSQDVPDKNSEQKSTPPNTSENKATPITYFRKIPVLLIVLISIIVLIAIAFLVKKQLRRRWYAKLLTLDKKIQVIKLYTYFLRILSVFGYRRKQNYTPLEFAQEMNNKSIKFYSVDFNKITEIFVQANYGNEEISEEDYKIILDFYNDFLKSCLEDSGLFRYILKYILL